MKKIILKSTLSIAAICGILSLTGCCNSPKMATKTTEQTQKLALADQIQSLNATTYHFGFDKASLSEEAKPELDRIVEVLLNNPETKVSVEGYTDVRGRPSYNLGLGMRRAKSVADYFVEKGIDLARIEIRSFGSENPLQIGDNDDAHAANRRAVIYFEVENSAVV